MLYLPARRPHRTQVVKPYEVRTPLPSLDMGEKRRICSHMHYVRVPLKSRHERRFQQGSMEMVPLLSSTMAGILPGKDLWAFPVVVVIAIALGQEPFFRTIEMLIHKVGTQPSHLRP